MPDAQRNEDKRFTPAAVVGVINDNNTFIAYVFVFVQTFQFERCN